ncbi:MAG: DNA methylase [Bacteroidaceae bacterium]|nr:DNA methylase [Bacteroidaceae bacterium]
MEKQRTYIAIDLKSFYASVECVERGLDPLTTNLVVADASRTDKTICLAITPSLKAYGLGGRARLFEVNQRIREVNRERCLRLPDKQLSGKSYSDIELKAHPEKAVDFIIAQPRMGFYIEYSLRIRKIYERFFSPEDIYIYSIDEIMCDVTPYLKIQKTTARDLTQKVIRQILKETGITATAGIGTNLYLAKVAMDIVAKHIPADENGVRIAELDEISYRKQLWDHTPITDFWQIGRGTAQRLSVYGIETMGELARCSIEHEDFLYNLFGKKAEIIIDHAWGWEPCTIEEIHSYQPKSRSISSGQVLAEPYDTKRALVIVKEMADELTLRLVYSNLKTNQVDLTINYDVSNLSDNKIRQAYKEDTELDFYKRTVPRHSHSTQNLKEHTSSSRLIISAASELYKKIVKQGLLIRRITIAFNHVITEQEYQRIKEKADAEPTQLSLFTDFTTIKKEKEQEAKTLERERKLQKTILNIKEQFGRNAILKGIDFEEGATARERNKQRGGHRE